jgi:hypothetical protein
MTSLRACFVLTAFIALPVACSSSNDTTNASANSGGTAATGIGGATVGSSANTNGTSVSQPTGGTSGTTTSATVASGSVQSGGPPCKPVYRTSLEGRTDTEDVVTVTTDMIQMGLVVNRFGVFWSIYDEVQSAPLTGGATHLVVAGLYDVVGTIGEELLVSTRNTGGTNPIVYLRVGATSVAGTATEILTLSATETYLTADDQFLYLYDSASTSLVRASVTNGARTTVESGVTYAVHEASVYGDYLYWGKDVYVMRVPKAGGTSETFYYDFDLWKFDVAQDKLLVGAGSTVNMAPLSDPTSMVAIASVPSGMFGTYIDWMTLANGRVFYQDSADGFGWVNFAGTQCEGLFAEDTFFMGTMQVFDGYVYVQDETTVRRLKLPQ